ncbi:dolichyl pyrophosphate Glc1Man9GlcNAc2 alpha-1,3-glucosyltransferase [Aristolochia californica]|uniref:dolichyl pyrophosphate Glc1Man9GlcNAc2 alpha-1,3-glucosyltransferase n=1 Tax=Aristolochia californica TaxID=171875 RepID=UPI0035DEC888
MTKKKKNKDDAAAAPAASSSSAMAELAWFAGVATCIKLLLIPSYRSTDFEVHRNWLALTSSLPLSIWYLDETSPWTLDYPPLFAYFERFLAFFARLVDPVMVDLHRGLGYSSNSVVVFQRVTVMISDIVLFYGVYRLSRNLDVSRRRILFALVVWSPALIIVDHIHFQYNGFLIGVLLISLSFLEEGRDLLGGFAFAVLLCLKHLFAVAGPLYFVYLLRHYCKGGFWRGFCRFLVMGAAVGSVFAVSFGPFLYYREIHRVLQRMFPFGRGLCHAYWAPNFWVFYIMLDKALAFMLGKLGFHIQAPAASFTSGLVGDSSPLSVLPQVTPAITFFLVLVAISPSLIKAWRNPQPRQFVRLVAYAYTCGFLFGWHVHEKASLHFVIPLAIIATRSLEDAKHYFLISIVSCYSMFPLLFEAKEYSIKLLLLVIHSLLIWSGFSSLFSKSESDKEMEKVKSRDSAERTGNGFIGCVEIIYLMGLLCIEIWCQFLHLYIFGDKLPFLPLMLVSIYCALGMLYSWIWQLHWLIKAP